jgi:hypothetical protein
VVSHPLDAAPAVGHWLSGKSGETGHYQFNSILEEPLRDSRITLDTRHDSFGLRRDQLHWRVDKFCERSIRETQDLIVEH